MIKVSGMVMPRLRNLPIDDDAVDAHIISEATRSPRRMMITLYAGDDTKLVLNFPNPNPGGVEVVVFCIIGSRQLYWDQDTNTFEPLANVRRYFIDTDTAGFKTLLSLAKAKFKALAHVPPERRLRVQIIRFTMQTSENNQAFRETHVARQTVNRNKALVEFQRRRAAKLLYAAAEANPGHPIGRRRLMREWNAMKHNF